MKKTIINVLALITTLTTILVSASCSKEEAPVIQEVVGQADVSMQIGGGAVTKSEFDAGTSTMNWSVGDRLVLVSNGKINGTISCESVDGSGLATFTGRLSDFTPASINVYFFCNRPVDGMTPSFDFSAQSGSSERISSYLFLKSLNVKFKKVEEEKMYVPEAPISFEAMVSLFAIDLTGADAPVAEGTKARLVSIDGLYNQLAVDLATGNVTPGFVDSMDGKKVTTTNVTPKSVAEYSTSYLIAVIPQEASGIVMGVVFVDGSFNGLRTYWDNINWSIGTGCSYFTDWSKQSLDIAPLSSKSGYSGSAVGSTETIDGQSHKNGYSGQTVGDAADDLLGQKSGYNGTEVL